MPTPGNAASAPMMYGASAPMAAPVSPHPTSRVWPSETAPRATAKRAPISVSDEADQRTESKQDGGTAHHLAVQRNEQRCRDEERREHATSPEPVGQRAE